MNNTAIAKRIWDVFTEPRPVLRQKYATARHQAGDILHFSPFNRSHADKADFYYEQFLKTVKAAEDEETGLNNVLDRFEEWIKQENPDLLYYALQSFLVNHKGHVLYMIPSLLAREPELTLPTSSAGRRHLEVAVGSPAETKMDWFREDPSLNEHHGHWHIVYNNRRRKDRQGEMFFYMHQQMIARYDADRLGSGVSRVQPFNRLSTQRIVAGYAPGLDVRLAQLIASDRVENALVMPEDGSLQESHLSDVLNDIDNNYYPIAHPQQPSAEIDTINALGSNVEANVQGDGTRSYENYHGNGHWYVGRLNNGVMLLTETAVRDAVFWEWHKGVDDLYFRIQEKFEPTDFTLHAPKITLRKQVRNGNEPYTPDIILCPLQGLPANAAELGETAFGGSNWEADFESRLFNLGPVPFNTTNSLSTKMNTGSIRYRDEDGITRDYEYPFLSHNAFCYFIRIENREINAQLLTIRIFMAPEETTEDRRSWIEMDKFIATIPGNTKRVIFRRDTESSVIKKPAVLDPSTYHLNFDPAQMPIDDRQCNCGWPYHLLLPKGKEEGMKFRLMVMVTNGDYDGLGNESDCGSISFCGSRNGDYPDKRPLGFPFNRKFSGNTDPITRTINSNPQMMCRTITIYHIP